MPIPATSLFMSSKKNKRIIETERSDIQASLEEAEAAVESEEAKALRV